MLKPKAIIFDLDGTLIHSAPDLQSAANAALTALGRETLDLPTIISFIGNGVEKLVERCLGITGGQDAALHSEAIRLFMESYNRNKTALTKPYPGVMDTLNQLRDAKVPLGICTNKPTQPALDICDALDLSPYFNVIAGAEDGQPKKPDAAPLLNCIAKMGYVTSDVLYVGDSAIDYHTARDAKVAFRLFSGGYLNQPLPDLDQGDRFDNWHAHGIATGRIQPESGL